MLDDEIIGKILYFADNTKVIGVTGTEAETELSMADLLQLYNFLEDWKMLFNDDNIRFCTLDLIT